jgi:hypothetical protein
MIKSGIVAERHWSEDIRARIFSEGRLMFGIQRPPFLGPAEMDYEKADKRVLRS